MFFAIASFIVFLVQDDLQAVAMMLVAGLGWFVEWRQGWEFWVWCEWVAWVQCRR
jgi:hypothetical protein